jgi:hypothetical protein
MRFYPTCLRSRKALLSGLAAGLLALGIVFAIPTRAPAVPPNLRNATLRLEEITEELHVFVVNYKSGGQPTNQQIELIALEFLVSLELEGRISEADLLDINLYMFIVTEIAIILFDIERGKTAVEEIPGHILFRRHRHHLLP